jgi:arylsulfatase A-like enzyme
MNGEPLTPMPRNVVVVLLDSLNRHMLGSYGGTEFETPNLDGFAARAIRFLNHYAGSLPCMPARHDLLCGALDFLWKPWGSIEIWEEAITVPLRAAGVVTKLVTDHPHLFEAGGENYHVDFTAWDYQRGHESDPWRTRPDPSWIGAPSFDRGHMPYDDSRGWFRGEEDFPGPRTMAAAARWLDEDAPAAERFLLLVDEFDPHEPFDTPEPYATMYDPGWTGPHLIWPPYTSRAMGRGVLTAEEARQVRAQYGGKLTMIDAWFGRLLDTLDRRDMWGDTAVIVCTDHGHYLGEKDIFGKPGVPVYEPLGHLPLLVHWPGVAPGERAGLTTTVDLHATLCEVFGVQSGHRTHGRSLVPVIAGAADSVREWALTGVWGREVHVVDGTWKYARAPVGDNAPLSMWSNRWSTMPVHRAPELRLPPPDDRAFLDRMPGSSIPVICQPFRPGDMLPFWAFTRFRGNLLFDLSVDPGEDENRAGTAAEKEAADKLREALREVEAPADQLERLGLS